MKLNQVLFGMVIAAACTHVQAAEPAPVIDASSNARSTSVQPGHEERLVNVERQIDIYKRNQVKMQTQLDDLQNEVNELRGVTELHSHQLSQILERQRELYQELDRRVTQALKPANVPVQQPVVEQPTASTSANVSENDAYDYAVNLVLKEKKYDDAIPAFQQFIEQYPSSSYAANAYYWLGQLLFNKGELAQAKNAFNVVVSEFTQSTKRSDAILKLGMVEQKQNNNARALNLYQQVISEYPGSSAAKLAQTRLSSIQ
ncbi:tol-pal system protein YbgF [Thalassotalea marina]|uniref:Cell division coordinator CpoB n=1 Tax=Thalassotalea marina TaxID=1673741 RepID=A0A919ELR6_9GAMM|nr:tol-pal system protein YbgF [Thalassotalea marina]GHF97489.1 tol-pal system protein YbgF [Thalassotalea marina]